MGIEKKDPANFSPSVEIPAKVDSFRFWCQKVLPLVYDDSLSYYELLCKVVDYLNNTIADVNTLGTDVDNLNKAYNELQSYVNNYFSTLDVQEEINNKLDTMTQDGTLSALIQPLFDTYKTDIDNEVNQQNNKINVLENRMSTFTNLPSGSTTGDAELTDIRVGYNGDTYPNAGDAVRGQVSRLYEDLDNTREEYQSINVANPKEFVFGSYYNSGTIVESDVYAHTGFIKVTAGDVVRFKDLSPYFNDYLRYDTFKNDKTPTETFPKFATKNENDLVEFTIESGKDIAYIIINFGKVFADTLMVTINNKYPDYFIPYYKRTFLNTNKLNLHYNILCTGDSICAGAGFAGGYATILKQMYPYLTVTNYGVGGTTISSLHENSILTRLDSMSNTADIVILEGGVNDGFLGVPIGEFSMTEDSETKTYDTNTFCGAVETLFKNAHAKWKNAYIMFLIPMVAQITQTNAYLEKAKEICKKWGVTTIDIRKSGMCVYSAELKNMYTNNGSGVGDGLHPNELGYKKFYLPMIEKALFTFFN